MPTEKLQLGETPHITITSTEAELELRGSDKADVRINSSEPFTTHHEAHHLTIDPAVGSLTIRLPEEGQVRIGQVGGSMLAKYIYGGLVLAGHTRADAVIRHCGPVALQGDVHGQLMLKHIDGEAVVAQAHEDVICRYIQSLHIEETSGDLHIAFAGGALSAVHTGGSLAIRYAEGPIRAEFVGGDATIQDAASSVELTHVEGDLSLDMAFTPGNIYRFGVTGDTDVRIHGPANVTFVLPPGADLNVDRGVAVQTTTEDTRVTLGSGEAVVHLHASGTITLTGRGGATAGPNDLIDRELSEELGSLVEEMADQFTRMDTLLGGATGRIRSRVKNRIDAARRRVEQAAEAVNQTVGSTPSTPTSDPITEEERMAILKLLEEGKISVDEAEKLLAALEQG